MRKTILLLFLLLLFLFFIPKSVSAYPAFPCNPDLSEMGDSYCNDPNNITGWVSNYLSGTLQWCGNSENIGSRGCRYFTNPESYYCEGSFPYEGEGNYFCDYYCWDPPSPINCLGGCGCVEGTSCIDGVCGIQEGGAECNTPDHCWDYNEGPCDSSIYDITYCIEEPPGSPGRCVCGTEEFFEIHPYLCRTRTDRGIDTAIGCIPVTSNEAFAEFLLRWGMGMGGGIAFIMIVYSGFLITSSAGNPQRLQAGKELLIAALTGIILIVFSVFLLRFFGYDILGIPGIT
jgi:hypothetical protein